MQGFDAILHAGPVQWAVLLLLFAFSLLSWVIAFLKWRTITKAQRDLTAFTNLFWQTRKFDRIFEESEDFIESPLVDVFKKSYQELSKIAQSDGDKQKMDGDKFDEFEYALKKTCHIQISEMEQMIPFLATVGPTAPFIGLFGTVIGIMGAFQQIGLKGSASLTTVAPGIAEALIATAVGLLVAVPAVIFYNYFAVKLRRLNFQLDTFGKDFLAIVRKNF